MKIQTESNRTSPLVEPKNRVLLLFRILGCALGATLIPFCLVWLDLKLERGDNAQIAIATGLAIGVVSILLLPTPKISKWIGAAVWVPLFFCIIIFFCFSYVCENYNNCI